jgi:hypothetical protein
MDSLALSHLRNPQPPTRRTEAMKDNPNEIDLRRGETHEYRVSTVRDGRYMGPDVLVDARSEEHAAEIVQKSGREVNRHFPPKRIRR